MHSNDEQTMRSMVRDDAYHVERVLAEGPSGKTELVTLDGEGPLVRKRIPAALANATAWATVMGIEEPLLPQVEEMYRMPDELVVVCAYVPGDSLRERMATQGRLDGRQAALVLYDLCHAAGVLHAHGIVHRDITPGNVILAADGAHLIDLGIARHGAKAGPRDTHVLGTWGFAAPEQFGFARTDARSDVYALGRMLGYMLTGIAPSDEAYEEALSDERLVTPALAAVIQRATAFEPSARYQTTAELATGLDEALEAEPVIATDARPLAAESAASIPAGASVPRRGMPQSQRLATTSPTASAARPRRTPGTSSPTASAPRQKRTHDSTSPDDDATRRQDVPALGPRPLNEAPILVHMVADLYWAAFAIWVSVMIFVGVQEARDGFPNWQYPQYVMAFATVIAAGYIAREAYWALTRRGYYKGKKVRTGMVLWRMAQALLCLVLTFVLLVIVIATLSD